MEEDETQEALDKAVSYLKSDSDKRTVNNTVRHQYRVLTDAEKSQMVAIKDLGLNFLSLVDQLGNKREYSVAKTKIEEAVMWAVKGLTG
jgi:hypothetical protein